MSVKGQKRTFAPVYSITSSAMATTPDGITRLRALAVLKLITNSNFVGSKTGNRACCVLNIFQLCGAIWKFWIEQYSDESSRRHQFPQQP